MPSWFDQVLNTYFIHDETFIYYGKHVKSNIDLLFLFTDFLFKFLVIGSAGTGKSCILHQFIENKCEYHRSVHQF